MNRDGAREKAKEALQLAAEMDDPKQAQAVVNISSYWLALATTLPATTPGMTAEAWL